MNSFLRFLSYHNAVPIALGVVFLGAGAAFAASPAARDAVFSTTTTFESVDNSYVLALDLAAFNPELTVTAISEDDRFYYVDYRYKTVAVDDYAWREIPKKASLAVSKATLGDRDLGIFVARELGQIIDRDKSYLAEVQGIERGRGETRKVATVEYAGLVGRLLEPKEIVFEGYEPVKDEPVPPELASASAESAGGESAGGVEGAPPASASAAPAVPDPAEIRRLVEEAVRNILAEREAQQQQAAAAAASAPAAASAETPSASDTEPPVISILGNNPAEIAVGTVYNDLGATVTDNVNDNLGYHVSVDGVERTDTQVEIDTSAPGEHAILYTATDSAGNTGTATRRVIVSAPEPPPEPPPADTSAGETATTTPQEEIPPPVDGQQ